VAYGVFGFTVTQHCNKCIENNTLWTVIMRPPSRTAHYALYSVCLLCLYVSLYVKGWKIPES